MNPMTDDNEAAAQVILAKLLEIYDVKTGCSSEWCW